ncbi:DUF4190 domain-containing protein [Nocardioides daeguensis]|uniref:DUF4190 domain-containing protein n=1 Tax=Nocardioides daeguensis TaxID=908359 RepID=A0ABP6WJP3_9ACTN|nr:DUF4190 domain-containing protein [Nocardioides daeguensis]MBV6729079.1 DUF4190 domain-containing protein [Nocardioides daeguensis]MCR1774917.1 DUF4190 domain-containing protein [Nocardioides daeguensis]
MSDPYGQNQPQNPYGQNQPPNPYGQAPVPPPPAPYASGSGGGYGAPGAFPGGSDPMPPKTDGISIAALVTSLLCCLAPLGVILGFVGLSRTKGGQRKGRGLAIAGIVIGLLMSIGTAVAGAALFVFADSVVAPGDAEVGQCVDIDEDNGTVLMREKKCTEEHDAEIVGIAKVTSDNLDAVENGMAAYCATAIDPDDLVKITPYAGDLNAVIEDPKDVSVGDHLVCYVEPDDELTKPIL